MTKPPSTSIPHVTDDQLLDLVHELRSPQEARDILDHLKGCESCESRFQQVVADREHGRVEWHTHRRSLKGRVSPGLFIGKTWRLAGTIAAVLAIASAALLMRGPAQEEFLWLSEPGGALVLRSQSPGEQDQLAAGLKAYTERDVSGAISALSTPHANAGHDLVRRLYLGSALAHQGKSQECITVLEGIEPSSLPSPWRSEIRWTLALAHYDVGNVEEARSHLQSIAQETTPWGVRAQELLEQWR